MQKKILVAALAVAGFVSANVQAEEGNFMVRARAVNLAFDNSNKDGLDKVGVGKVSAEDLWIPEVDFSYFMTKNLALELVLTYPQQVDIRTSALGKIGHVDVLPPSLVLQYHFTNLGMFKPYVGVGLNYSIFTKKSFNTALGKISVDNDSIGAVAQLGADFMLTKNWSLNVDVKYITMDTKVKLDGAKLGTLDLSPVTAGIGIGYRF
ncbi:OmpW/AlkL family protein [Dechloromonas sp. A34]|uniref:OmpW/AlkL family protein n=1 Tax=Dechloromonas sp. A34 TaxID=447588 RepID=UPI0022496204|nr:OmpW family outer membrane protein [Dechloromonas sp. A34]